MTLLTLLSFATMALLLVISPGPNGLLIAKTVPASGRAAGFAAVLGFTTSFYVQGAFVIFGVAVVLVQSAELFFIVKMLGAAYLIWIGVKALYQAWRNDASAITAQSTGKAKTLLASYGEGFLTNIFNPKTSMFYLAAVPQFLPIGEATAANVLLLVFIHSTINLLWFCAMVLLVARLTKFAKNNSTQRWIKGITGAIFIGFGAKLATLRA